MLDVVARTTSIVFDLMQCFFSDCHDIVLVMFRCVYSCPRSLLRSGNSNCDSIAVAPTLHMRKWLESPASFTRTHCK